nr:replication/maintenance protein RepL [Acidomonas methanolica]
MPRRLAFVLMELVHQQQFFDASTKNLKLGMSRSKIAEYISTTPESVSRAFSYLFREKYIDKVDRNTIRVNF